jgi:oligopeptide/dipeptide ABC transporter ATP-binding protein
VLSCPEHPYARALMAAVPVRGRRGRARMPLAGQVPNALAVPAGCRFHPRCPDVRAICRTADPPVTSLADGRQVACHLHAPPIKSHREAHDAADIGADRRALA